MNLADSSFLCLDIGTSGVRGIAHRVRAGRLAKSAMHAVDSFDTVFALKSVIDELEQQIGDRFDSAYITGNLGPAMFKISPKTKKWRGEHKITQSDISSMIAQITPPDGYYPIHIIPLRYETPNIQKLYTPVGYTDYGLTAIFGAIFYSSAAGHDVTSTLHAAHIQPYSMYDPHFLQNAMMHTKKSADMYIDFGAQYTTVSIWLDNGPIFFQKIPFGGTDITRDIAEKLDISFDDAERIKRSVAGLMPREMDRFTPADTAYDFSRADVNNIVLPNIVDLCERIKEACATPFKHRAPNKIIISGGGAEMDAIGDFIENVFAIPVQNAHRNASVQALSAYVWSAEAAHRRAYAARSERVKNIFARLGGIMRPRKKQSVRFIPIMPSTLCFDMKSPETYSMFRAGGISMIHVDIMDGLYVENIRGGIPELKYIRAHTGAHLHVHLMTESPDVWAADAIAAGANTIIVSTNTSGVRAALRLIRGAGRRAGVALNPESSVEILKPILRDIDEVMIMTVTPGAAGQEFNESCLHKISILAATRKKYGLKYLISVDGGINAETAQKCWDAGADLLVSGSYLARSADFPLAVQSLLRTPTSNKTK
ncbi:MAG TPA: ribulose-phosphate 3-epimerase [Candidatus Enterousia intestinigallinarum]|uniref:Ribulose-phosphate 3-epimerase n=1 Tax=Candidatus Enterousia intestinigallinarum TaxID=2840790 RepID=A0A9D1FFP0_9PROT|nr:ribulose-phosphate 3-epimerase [Candidatus Enterousia intestinigallinarum]